MVYKIRCNLNEWATYKHTQRIVEVEDWLRKNLGHRWRTWDWIDDYSTIIMSNPEIATLFKLRFGL